MRRFADFLRYTEHRGVWLFIGTLLQLQAAQGPCGKRQMQGHFKNTHTSVLYLTSISIHQSRPVIRCTGNIFSKNLGAGVT